jgi:F-type H+-transporting ATPase subunit b
MASWWTFGFQIVNVLALVWLLNRFLFRPVRRTLAARQQRDADAAARAKEVETASDRAHEEVARERAQAQVERDRLLETARVQIAAEREQVLAQARRGADDIIAEARRSIADERAKALSALQGQAAQLAAAIAARLLADVGSPVTDDAFLGRIEALLDELPRARVRELAVEAASGLEIVTAHGLDPAAISSWSSRVAAKLGVATPIAFRTEPSLIAGAELHFRTAVLAFSWRDALGHVLKELEATHAIAS